MLQGVKKAHFIGIGGVGMSATAKILKDTGVAITGSDEEVYEPVLSYLKKERLPYATPYTASNIPADVDLVVIGKNAKLVADSNKEVKAAFDSGKPVSSYPEVLSELSQNKETLVVAGSYGKSTVTALIAHCLERAGKDPSFFIGAIPYTPTTSTTLGKGNFFVIEGDEYPSSNTDPRAKFLHYHPTHLLITPLAHDHFNIFPTPADYLQPFTSLIKLVPKGGRIVACVDGPLSKQFIKKDVWPIITYGLREGDYHAGDIEWGGETSFTISHGSAALIKVTTTLLGEHNIQNIVGVAALLFELNAVTPEQFAAAVTNFKGINRRLDKKSEKTSIPMYEGFGSSYEKARSAIEAMRQHFPNKRLVVLFEPHTFGWRNYASLPRYDTAFEGADAVYILAPAEHGAGNQQESSFEDIVERVKKSGVVVSAAGSAQDILETLDEELSEQDCVLLLSSGPMGNLIEDVPKLAEQKFPV